MNRHVFAGAGGPRLTPAADFGVRVAATVLMLAGAVMLVAGLVSSGIGIPLITVGIALVVVGQADRRRRPA
jgi:hypothetical protein